MVEQLPRLDDDGRLRPSADAARVGLAELGPEPVLASEPPPDRPAEPERVAAPELGATAEAPSLVTGAECKYLAELASKMLERLAVKKWGPKWQLAVEERKDLERAGAIVLERRLPQVAKEYEDLIVLAIVVLGIVTRRTMGDGSSSRGPDPADRGSDGQRQDARAAA